MPDARARTAGEQGVVVVFVARFSRVGNARMGVRRRRRRGRMGARVRGWSMIAVLFAVRERLKI
jgi:hypothetical protein